MNNQHSDIDATGGHNQHNQQQKQQQQQSNLGDPDIKIILLGDSAVGKSKLIERYLEDQYNPQRVSVTELYLFIEYSR